MVATSNVNNNTNNTNDLTRLRVNALIDATDPASAIAHTLATRPTRDLFSTQPIRGVQQTNPPGNVAHTANDITAGINNRLPIGTNGPDLGPLSNTAATEANGASNSLNQVSGAEDPQLPPGQLTQNADGSITTPGGYKVSNLGNETWTITSPDGFVTKISGDPHVDEGNDGSNDWNFNQDGSFILPDGTKILCDTDKVSSSANGEDITVSHMLYVQYQDSLATMDVMNNTPTQLVQAGGKAFDESTSDGELFVMGNNDKWYDGISLGKLIVNPNDDTAGIDMNDLGQISDLAQLSITKSLQLDKPDAPDRSKEGDLGTLAELGDNGFLVDDSDNGLEAAAAAGGKKPNKAKILGQANQAGNGTPALDKFDTNGDGVISGNELNGIKVWVDKNNDGKVEDGEISVLADFNVKSLNVRMAVTNTEDGNQRLDGTFMDRDGQVFRTSDTINPLIDGAQGSNFQRQLQTHVANDPGMAQAAQNQLNHVASVMNNLPTTNAPPADPGATQMANDLARRRSTSLHSQRG